MTALVEREGEVTRIDRGGKEEEEGDYEGGKMEGKGVARETKRPLVTRPAVWKRR